METIEAFDRIRWAELKESFKTNYGEYPSVISLLFLAGLEHCPVVSQKLTKEEKQEVIHVGLCSVLQQEELYVFSHHDEDGWPHFITTEKAKHFNIEKQENFIKQLLINYFHE